jgi:2-dehydro-3-deoxyphosphogluconate aldolase/(4S)-4-hydroxy-2-oxoglutarate aldolase
MTRESIFSSIVEIGIVPVVRTESADGAIRAIQALYRGGIRSAEITMTVPGAIRALEKVADEFGDRMILGAGTVLDPETARACMLAGAEFFVTPTLKISTIEMVKRYSKVIMPGALTPTEILTAWEAGADAVKVFPCGAVGGAKYIKAVRGPLPHVEMVPTGGVNLETVADFLKAGACAVGVGAELIDSQTIREGKFEVFEQRAVRFLDVIKKARESMRQAA